MNIKTHIANRYGSKKGLLRYYKYLLLQILGFYRDYRPTELHKVRRLVYICSGNICRSPLGDIVAREHGQPSVSFGLHCRGGDPAFTKTLEYGIAQKLPVEQHRSTHISKYTPIDGDLLIVMEPAHANELKALFPDTQQLLLGYLTDWNNVYIHDPYNTNEVFFNQCMQQITLATERLIRRINEK